MPRLRFFAKSLAASNHLPQPGPHPAMQKENKMEKTSERRNSSRMTIDFDSGLTQKGFSLA
jgi:hypothetical protein